MKRHVALTNMALAFVFLFGTAFSCGTDNRRTGSNAERINGGPPPPERSADALKVGEYACYGSGGRIMIGLGFKVLPSNRYTDLDGKESGTFSISGTTVTFSGGHLDGQTGRNLRNYKFTIGAQAECEPF